VDQKPETIVIMAKLADDYDKLADEAETRGNGTPKTHRLVLGPLRSA
jgi:hypothetical protein